MSVKDLHAKPFDEGTIAKLEIFEDYAQAWIPTFVMMGSPKLLIVDFFAGTGYDKNAVPGSPIRILQKLVEQAGNIRTKNVFVTVLLNEFDATKFAQLTSACEDFIRDNPVLKGLVDVRLTNEDFEVLFPKVLPEIQSFPSLIYLDQNGIKYLSPRYLLELEKIRQCDFLYFVSASYFWRFGNQEEFKIHLPIDMEEARGHPYRFIHRSLIDQLRQSLPTNSDLQLYPFTIRKGSNIYGIIFGATHPRAVEKFLTIAWKRDETSGEANFDINEEGKKAQSSLFDPPRLTKLEAFQQLVEEMILDGSLTNNFDLLDFTLKAGHLGRHSADVLRRLKRQGIVSYDAQSPLVTYEAVHKDRRKINYEVLK